METLRRFKFQNSCDKLVQLVNTSRNTELEKIKNIVGHRNQLSLEGWIIRIYFSHYPDYSKKETRDLIETTKTFVGDF